MKAKKEAKEKWCKYTAMRRRTEESMLDMAELISALKQEFKTVEVLETRGGKR